MKKKCGNNQINCRNRHGIVLLVTLVLLVVLSTLGYALTSRIAAQRHRDRYMIDYSIAKYGCDSAVKYALAALQEIKPQLISRSDEPDFSDLFSLSEAEYELLLENWAAAAASGKSGNAYDVNDVNDANSIPFFPDFNEPNSLTIRGPYGPPWPFITEPLEFKIGTATVKIEIEDENAKYPLGWAMLDDKDSKREAQASLETFFEWMDVNSVHVDTLKKQLDEIGKIKPYKLEFRTIVLSERRMGTARGPRGSRRTTRVQEGRQIPASVHTTDFAKLFHSSLIDTYAIAKPTIVSDTRTESPLKYMGMWGSTNVNVNTAPRHVLEAAFTFGGDADKIAEEIIQRRRLKPFENIEDLRKSLFRYAGSITKCEKYITTASNVFMIRITAVSGMAKVSAVAAVIKQGDNVERIALISG